MMAREDDAQVRDAQRRKKMKTTKTIRIGRDYTYTGTTHRWATGLKVRIVAKLEGGLVEFAPYIFENGKERLSWATSDARRNDLQEIAK